MIMKFIKCSFAVLFILIFGYIIYGLTLAPLDAPSLDLDFAVYDGEWELIDSEGGAGIITLPAEVDAGRGETVRVRTLLTDDAVTHPYMCFQGARQDIKIYVGDELRVSYSTASTRHTGKYTPPVYVMCPIFPGDAGKYITYETVTLSSYSGVIYSVYIGEKMGLWYMLIKQQGMDQLVAFWTLMLGILVTVSSVFIAIRSRRKIELTYLGLVVVFASIWLIANSNLRQIIFPALSVINDVTFLMLLLLPMTFCIYLDSIQKYRYTKAYRVVCIADIINSIICIILHVSAIRDFSETFIFMALVAVAAIILMMATMIKDFVKGDIRDYILVAIGTIVVLATAAGQIFIYLNKSDQFHTLLLEFGLIFLLMMSMFNTIRDIIRLNRDKDEALLARQSESRFLANMSHEIRTPINAILGFNSLILRESKEKNIREYAADIESSGNTLLALINDILDLSRVESGKLELMSSEYDLFGMVDNVIRMMKIKADAKGLKLLLKLDEDLPRKLIGDDVRIRQILVNLIGNAIKYTEKGQVTLNITGKLQGEEVVLDVSVKDTGTGIKKEDMDRLFEKYARINEEKNRDIEGTGLGLSITLQLLRLFGSTINVESEFGKGSVFSFKLKQAISDKTPIGDIEALRESRMGKKTADRKISAPGVRVFMCDDNPLNRKLFLALLKDTGMNITSAENGKSAEEILKKEKYDIIFMDDMMPDINGSEIVSEIKSDLLSVNHDTPIVVFTANVLHGVREMYLEAGFDEYLSKPVKMDRLERIFEKFLPDGSWFYDSAKAGDNSSSYIIKENIKDISSLPDITGVSWDTAIEKIGDIYALDEMIGSFVAIYDNDAYELDEMYNKLKLSSDAKDGTKAFSEYRVKVHSMKSASAIIGAMQISALAQLLENASGEDKADYIYNIHPVFITEWRRIGKSLEQYYDEKHSHDKNAVRTDIDTLKDDLKLLLSAVEELDTDTADSVMDRIESYIVDEETGVLLKKLKNAVLNLEADDCAELIERITESYSQGGGLK